MFCRNCQTIIPDDSVFCENCGAPTGLIQDEIDEQNLVPEEAVEFEVSEEPVQAASVPVDPVWWEPPDEPAEDGHWDDWDEEEAPEETQEPEIPEEPAEAEPSEEPGAFEEPEESAEPEETSEPEPSEEAEPSEEPAEEPEESGEHLKEELKHIAAGAAGIASGAAERASEAASQAKPYLEKAKSLLGNLGKNVRTGTGWAADAAKQQFQQKKEEFEEKKEQREKQKEEERQLREEERLQQEEEQTRTCEERRQADLKAQEELEKQKEIERKELEEDLIQGPGFWYGREEPKAPEAAPETAEEEPESAEEAPAEGAETAEATDAPSEESVPEEYKEDKLANTAHFSWTEMELEHAAASGSGEDTEGSAEKPAGAEEGEGAEAAGESEAVKEPDPEDFWKVLEAAEAKLAAKAAEPKEEDEPAIYRIKDYEPVQIMPAKPPIITKTRLKIAAVIAVIIIGIAIVTGVLLYQAHERELEEEAYMNSVKQAEQLVQDEKYKEAEAMYLQLMQQRPEDTQLYLELAEMYVDQERYVDAKALIKRAIKITGDKEAFTDIKSDIKVLTSNKWKKAYIEVLQENEDGIRRYEEDVQASVAVCDVNGDIWPELFFFTKEYYGYGKLHIYTTVDGKAKEVDYECKNRGTQYQDAFYDVSRDTSSYAVFNSKEEGVFSIYCNLSSYGADSWDTTNVYKLNLKGGCKRLEVIEGSIDLQYGENEYDNSAYLKDDEGITYDMYMEEFKKILNEAAQVILYNGTGGDQSVWMKVNPDTVMCMSYDSMMVDLKADTR